MGRTEVYELLCILDFNNDRKRMSVILRKDDRITLYCKGADSTIYPRLNPKCAELQQITTRHLSEFAQNGLRTLCCAVRDIDPAFYAEWEKRHHLARLIVRSVLCIAFSISNCFCSFGYYSHGPRVGLRKIPLPPYLFTFPLPHLLLYLLVSFAFPFSPFLLASFIFLLFRPCHSTRILPLCFQARCRRTRLNLALSFFVLILCYIYCLVKDAYLFL